MKQTGILLLLLSFCFFSCQKEETEERAEDEIAAKVLPMEYLRAEIDGYPLELKDTALIAGTVYPSRNTGVINFDFSAWIKKEKVEEEIYDGFMFKLCFYDGPGTYYTGTKKTVNWAMYWDHFQLWENHYSYGNEPGIVTITNATDEFVEGTFEFEAYNPEIQDMIYATGEFGLKLETQEQYRQ